MARGNSTIAVFHSVAVTFKINMNSKINMILELDFKKFKYIILLKLPIQKLKKPTCAITRSFHHDY